MLEAARALFGLPSETPLLAQTPRDELPLEGGARLLHFRGTKTIARPILLVPSLINRWYVLDLRPGASLVEALVGAGFDVWLLAWGIPEAEDRYLDWDSVLRRLARAARRVSRETRQTIGLLGYCMGGTLAAIHAAQHADSIAALVTLCAPIDFAHGGMLRRMVDSAWFDAGAHADAGNVSPALMQAGFAALRPTLELAKLVAQPDLDPEQRAAVLALEAWASDNIPFPGEAYRRYVSEVCQGNELVAGTHRVDGKPVSPRRDPLPDARDHRHARSHLPAGGGRRAASSRRRSRYGRAVRGRRSCRCGGRQQGEEHDVPGPHRVAQDANRSCIVTSS